MNYGDLMSDMEKFTSIDRKINKVIEEFFPKIFIQGHGNTGNDFRAYLTVHNRYFEETEYFYKGELKFFHLTSVQNLMSILNQRAFRLYNLHNSGDEHEYGHAGELLQLKNYEIETKKDLLYSLSVCPISELDNKTVWETYGGNFAGAAIIFTVDNDPRDWDNFHLSDVKYNKTERFKEYFEKKSALEKALDITVDCDLSRLMAFHKEAKWESEKEVRILTYYPFESPDEFLKYSKPEFRFTNGRNRIVRYINLPLWVDNDSELVKSRISEELDRTQVLPNNYFNIHPKIKISNILIGRNSGIDNTDYGRYREELKQLIRMNFGYEVDIEHDLYG